MARRLRREADQPFLVVEHGQLRPWSTCLPEWPSGSKYVGSVWGLASVGSVLIAEDLLLLLTDDTSGRLSTPAAKAEILLAGANLVDLALMGRVDISRAVKPIPFLGINRTVDRLIVRDRSPTGDAVLDAALQIASRGQGRLSWVLRQRGKNLQMTLYKRLVSSGMIRHEQRTILAVAMVDRWPAQDSRHKVEVRRRVIQALVEQTTPDTRSAALIALLHTIEHEPAIVDSRYARFRSRNAVDIELFSIRSQVLGRGEEIAKSTWAPEAIRNSIDAIIATTRDQALNTIAKVAG
jgi:Golgi phosphoprotein 3 (GPP34)